jgi:hypothetical protein
VTNQADLQIGIQARTAASTPGSMRVLIMGITTLLMLGGYFAMGRITR